MRHWPRLATFARTIGATIWTIAKQESMSARQRSSFVSEWLDTLQQVRSEQEKNDYAKKCSESLRVLQQLVFEIIETEPVNDEAPRVSVL
jgi:hypothetical protein